MIFVVFVGLVLLASSANPSLVNTTVAVTAKAALAEIKGHLSGGMLRREFHSSMGDEGDDAGFSKRSVEDEPSSLAEEDESGDTFEFAFEDDDEEHLLEDPGDIYVWETFEKNHDGHLDEKEMANLYSKSGLKTEDWKSYDMDKDNMLNETEYLNFITAHKHDCSKAYIDEVRTAVFEGRRADGSFIEEEPEEPSSYKDDSSASLNLPPSSASQDFSNHMFRMADLNANGFLETGEMAELMATTHQRSTDKAFDWKIYDKNGDGKLSEDEFSHALSRDA